MKLLLLFLVLAYSRRAGSELVGTAQVTGATSPPLAPNDKLEKTSAIEAEELTETALPLELIDAIEGVENILSEPYVKKALPINAVLESENILVDPYIKKDPKTLVDPREKAEVTGEKPEVQILPMPIAVGEPNPGQKPIDFSLDGYFYRGAKKIAAYRIDFRGVHFKKEDKTDDIIEEVIDEILPEIVDEPEVNVGEPEEKVDATTERTAEDVDAQLLTTKANATIESSKTTETVEKTPIVLTTKEPLQETTDKGVTERVYICSENPELCRPAEDPSPESIYEELMRRRTTEAPNEAKFEETDEIDDLGPITGPKGNKGKSTAKPVETTRKSEEPVPTTGAPIIAKTTLVPVESTKKSEPAPTTGAPIKGQDPTTKGKEEPVPTSGAPLDTGAVVYTGLPPKPDFGKEKCTKTLVFAWDTKALRCLANAKIICSEKEWEDAKANSFGACMKAAPKVAPAEPTKTPCKLGFVYAQVPGEPAADLYGKRCSDAFCPKVQNIADSTCVQEKTAAHCCVFPKFVQG